MGLTVLGVIKSHQKLLCNMGFFPEFRKFQVVKSCPWMPGLYCNNARIVD
jgi:hypothetical protein